MLVVVPALLADTERIYDVYFQSFLGDKMGAIMLNVLFPTGVTPEFRTAHTKATMDFQRTNTVQYTYKCMDTETGEIVGMALADWYYKPRPASERVNYGVPWLEGKARARAETILNPLFEARERIFGGLPYLYVHVIAVDPKHQGRRAGAAFVEWGLEMSEKLRLPVYFEASPTTAALYERFGYKRLEEKIVHKGESLGLPVDIEVPLMVLMPKVLGVTFEEYIAKKPVDVPEEAAAPAETPAAEAEAPKTEEAAPAAAEEPKVEEAAPVTEAPKAEEAAPVAEPEVVADVPKTEEVAAPAPVAAEVTEEAAAPAEAPKPAVVEEAKEGSEEAAAPAAVHPVVVA